MQRHLPLFDGRSAARISVLNAVAFIIPASLVCSPLSAQPLVVTGLPAYDATTGNGFQAGYATSGFGVNNNGTAVGVFDKYVSGNGLGFRAVRWNASGTAATELGTLGANALGYTNADALAVNDNGTVVGDSYKYVSGSDNSGRVAVRWDAVGTTATELGNLGTDLNGNPGMSGAFAINAAGTAVGASEKYFSGVDLGLRAVRWDDSGTAATELGNLGTDATGFTYAGAGALNMAGTIVGVSEKYVSGSDLGRRAVRWDASGAATELGNLGTDASGFGDAGATAVNDAGTAVGQSSKYLAGVDMGTRAVRWDASRNTAIELGNLGTDARGYTVAYALAVNAAGTAVGWSNKYVSGFNVGMRAIRWDASATAATELGNLGTDFFGETTTFVHALNASGTAVGYARKYVAGSDFGQRAVIWLRDGSAIDLNDLGVVANPPGGTWLLTDADAISDNGWVSGDGVFTPTGGSPYLRAWVAHVSRAVPEPGTLWLGISALAGCRVLRMVQCK
jgi:hypothetical protein